MAKITAQTEFGGAWTQQKLECLAKYLSAYTQIFHKNPRARHFDTTYVDAFAGTGYLKTPEIPLLELMPELMENVEEYQKGSVVRALEVEPGFDHYVFIEKDAERFRELQALRKKFPEKDIHLNQEDANSFLQKWCAHLDPKKSRAVVFLDPFGANVSWSVIESIATTKAIDLWILFPIFAVNRMLIRDRKPPEGWSRRLDQIFGTRDWENEFYTVFHSSLFESVGLESPESIEKVADYEKIGAFFVARLRSIFVAAADPLVLTNSRGSPLYLFCFAAGNQRGATTGLKIARDIIRK
jgi:three-Cys-motif partner protein